MKKMRTELKDIFDIKKTMSLTKILCKDYFQKIPIFKLKDSAQGTFFKMCMLIAIIGLGYISYYIIRFLNQTGQPQIFLNIYLLFMAIVIMFQQIIASANIYYFSKDLEYILPYPIKPIELLMARFNMLMSISYISVAMFMLIPLLLYGLIVTNSIMYYLSMFLVIITFPFIFGLIVSTIMLVVMQLTKIIKNKTIFEFAVTLIMISVLMLFMTQAIQSIFANEETILKMQQGESITLLEVIDKKLENLNKYLLTISPSIKLLTETNLFLDLFEFIKIIIINLIGLTIFIFTGKLFYLKNILKNIQKVNIKKEKRGKANLKIKESKKSKKYIINEIKELFRVPAFFLQCVLPIITTVLSLIFIFVTMYPSIIAIMQDETLGVEFPEFKVDISVVSTILIIIQIIYTFSNLSITAISRKGKNAIFIKYIPIDLYKQFIYLNLPQVMLNILVSIAVLGTAKYLVPEITIIHLGAMFIIALLLNIINSFLMLAVDLRRPNLEWDTETDAIRQNKNKLYQYVLSIVIGLIFVYFSTVFEKIDLNLAIIIIFFILIIILFLINKIIKNKINKLFNKII